MSSGCETSTECEECGEGDSCVETDKCYCSLRGDPRNDSRTDSRTDSGHTTDTTCYSQSSRVSRAPLSSCDSPGTAWRRNMKSSMGSVSGASLASCTCSLYSEYTRTSR